MKKQKAFDTHTSGKLKNRKKKSKIAKIQKNKNTHKTKIFHSQFYKNGKEFKNQEVIVVGCGNSGAEIAMDIWEQGGNPKIVIRSPIAISQRKDIHWSAHFIDFHKIPPVILNKMGNISQKLSFGDMTKYGIQLKNDIFNDVLNKCAAPLIVMRLFM